MKLGMRSPCFRPWLVAEMALLVRSPIQLPSLMAAVSGPARGAMASFLGLVRNHHANRPVRRLIYSAYEPMAEAVLAQIVAEAESRWPVRVGLQHRLGTLEIGETAVAVVVAGAHRDEAFSACRYLIEELKRRVPIWKQETYTDGSVEWVNPTDLEVGIEAQGASRPV